MCETSILTSSKYWVESIFCCTSCGTSLIPTEYTNRLTKEKFDTALIPYFVFSNQNDRAMFLAMGKLMRSANVTERGRAFRQAQKSSITNRSCRDYDNMLIPRVSTSYWVDHTAKVEKSFIATWSERQRYENNWKLALNVQGPIAPMRERRLLRSCQSYQNFFRQKDEQDQYHPTVPSHQTR